MPVTVPVQGHTTAVTTIKIPNGISLLRSGDVVSVLDRDKTCVGFFTAANIIGATVD